MPSHWDVFQHSAESNLRRWTRRHSPWVSLVSLLVRRAVDDIVHRGLSAAKMMVKCNGVKGLGRSDTAPSVCCGVTRAMPDSAACRWIPERTSVSGCRVLGSCCLPANCSAWRDRTGLRSESLACGAGDGWLSPMGLRSPDLWGTEEGASRARLPDSPHHTAPRSRLTPPPPPSVCRAVIRTKTERGLRFLDMPYDVCTL